MPSDQSVKKYGYVISRAMEMMALSDEELAEARIKNLSDDAALMTALYHPDGEDAVPIARARAEARERLGLPQPDWLREARIEIALRAMLDK